MAKIKKLLALILSICVICTVSVMSVSAANTDDDNDTSASSTITVHYYCEEGTPTIYYWNSLPKNISTEYPGVKMTSEGNNYYKYTFNDVTKINMMFVTNGKQSAELTRNTGEWWYKNKRWSSKNPENMQEFDRVDMREDTIYFVITTRFYDGDTGNDVHCWDDSQANNPDSDPAWRGDFKGLIDKLDYIKALGFSAIWITPVVTNASGYDYHGYHAMDFSTVDVRYESDGATYQDLIDAAQCCGKFLSFLRFSRIHIECARCDLAAAEFLDQVKGTRHTDLNGVLRDTFFVVAGCVCVLSETSRSFTDVVAHELCGFKEKLCRILCDLTVHSAHDTRKSNRLASVADHKVILV